MNTIVIYIGCLLIFLILLFEYDLGFRISILNKFMLRKLNKNIKFTTKLVDLADIGLSIAEDKNNYETEGELKKEILSIMDDLSVRYKRIMTRICSDENEHSHIMKFIYESDFNKCIKSASNLERKFNFVIKKYK